MFRSKPTDDRKSTDFVCVLVGDETALIRMSKTAQMLFFRPGAYQRAILRKALQRHHLRHVFDAGSAQQHRLPIRAPRKESKAQRPLRRTARQREPRLSIIVQESTIRPVTLTGAN